MKLKACRITLTAVAVMIVAMLISGDRPLRVVGSSEAAMLRGGAGDVCALAVINTAFSCNGRVVTVGDTQYKCDGTNLDQTCSSATTNTHNICDDARATCGGNQQKKDITTGFVWADDGPCTQSTNATARLQAANCNPEGG
jgi:hypothetical protein